MSEATPSYDDTDVSTESGSGTPEPAANQPAGQPELDHREIPTLPASGSVASGDPQAASPARITRESELGGDGVLGTGAAVMQQGQTDAPPPTSGAGQGELGVSDTTTGGVPVERGRKAGAVTHSEVVGSVRPHAPDGEVSPT